MTPVQRTSRRETRAAPGIIAPSVGIAEGDDDGHERSLPSRAVSRLAPNGGQRRRAARGRVGPAERILRLRKRICGRPFPATAPQANERSARSPGARIEAMPPPFSPPAALRRDASAVAAPRLKPLMRDWKAQANEAEPMLSGAAPYDEAELRQILARWSAIRTTSRPELPARAPRRSTSRAGFPSSRPTPPRRCNRLGAQDRARTRFMRVRGDCRSCHDAFAN